MGSGIAPGGGPAHPALQVPPASTAGVPGTCAVLTGLGNASRAARAAPLGAGQCFSSARNQ